MSSSISMHEIVAHLAVADEALAWLIEARKQFNYETFQEYEHNMPELVRFFRRLYTTTANPANDFFSILPDQYVPTPEIGKKYWFFSELINITKLDKDRYGNPRFHYTKANEDNETEHYTQLRFAGLLVPYKIDYFADKGTALVQYEPKPLTNEDYSNNIKLCKEITEETDRINYAARWITNYAQELQTEATEHTNHIDPNNMHFESVCRIRDFAERLLKLTEQLLPGQYIHNNDE